MAWVNVALGLASLIFAVFAWWMANGARAARDAAQDARDQVARQTDAVETIASTFIGPLLTAQHLGDNAGTIVVRNPGTEPVTIESLSNEDEFHMFRSYTGDGANIWPATIPPRALHKFFAVMNLGFAMPNYFEFQVTGRESPIYVGIEPSGKEPGT